MNDIPLVKGSLPHEFIPSEHTQGVATAQFTHRPLYLCSHLQCL